MKKILTCLLLLIAVFSLFAEGNKEKQDATSNYPKKNIEVIIPWAPGGSTDGIARSVMNIMEKKFFPGKFTIINKPGGGGLIGTTDALNAKPDGYTIMVNSWGSFITQPALQDVPFGPDDYMPVVQLTYSPRIVVANPKAPYNNMKEMMDYVAANPEKVHVGVASVGTTDWFAFLELELKYGAKFTITPQNGGAAAKVAVLGNHIDVTALTVGESANLLESGMVKFLGVMSAEREPTYPDLKTCIEQGIDIESGVANHVYVPAGTPEPIVTMLHDALVKTMKDPEFLEIAKKMDLNVSYLSGEDSRKQLNHFRDLYSDIANKLELKQ